MPRGAFFFWCTLVEFEYLHFTCIPGESYHRWLRSLLLCLCDLFQVLINSLVCWFKSKTVNSKKHVLILTFHLTTTDKSITLCNNDSPAPPPPPPPTHTHTQTICTVQLGTYLRCLKHTMKGKELADVKTLDGKGRLTKQLIKCKHSLERKLGQTQPHQMTEQVRAVWFHRASTEDDLMHHCCTPRTVPKEGWGGGKTPSLQTQI